MRYELVDIPYHFFYGGGFIPKPVFFYNVQPGDDLEEFNFNSKWVSVVNMEIHKTYQEYELLLLHREYIS